MRFAFVVGSFVAVASASRVARAESTSLKAYEVAPAYSIGGTGAIPTLNVATVSGVVSGPNGGNLPDVSPGHAVTLTILVSSSSGTPVPRGNVQISIGGTSVNVSLPVGQVPIPVIGMMPVVGSKLAGPAMGVGVKYTVHLPPGQHSITAQYTDPTGAIGASLLSTNIQSKAHTAVDVDCSCKNPDGSVTKTCIQSGKPTSPNQQLICSSHAFAETVTSNSTVPFWSTPPVGWVDFNVQGIGIKTGNIDSPTSSNVATIAQGTPSQTGAYPISAVFQSRTGGIALPSAAATTSVTVSPAP